MIEHISSGLLPAVSRCCVFPDFPSLENWGSRGKQPGLQPSDLGSRGSTACSSPAAPSSEGVVCVEKRGIVTLEEMNFNTRRDEW